MSLPPEAELKRHLEAGAPIFVPVNPIEYHGPHLSLRNDNLVSVGIAKDLHERFREALGDHPFLLAPELDVGVDPCAGPGSRPTPFVDVRRQVLETVHRLADLGAQRVVLMTFHGSPLHSHALQAGVDALAARGVRAIAPLNLALVQQARGHYEGVEEAWMPVEDEALRAALRADVAIDFHAGFVETSFSLHYAPETVRDHRELPPCPPIVPQRTPQALARFARAAGLERLGVELDVLARGLAWYALRPFPGYTGRPHLANPESGSVFARVVVNGFAEASLAVFEGAPAPRPILEWMKIATLSGRIFAVDVPLEAVGLPG